MSDAEPTPRPDALRPEGLRTTSTGVVDPIRVAGSTMLTGFWSGLPILGRAFLVAAVLDVVARALGIAGLSLFIDLAHPLTILTFLPHLAFVLFPVAVLWRNPEAASEGPLVLLGAVALGLVELLSGPLFALVPPGGNLTTFTLLQVVSAAVRTGGYVLLARGLTALTRSTPTQGILGLANLSLWVLVGSAVTSMLLVILVPFGDSGEPALGQQISLINTVGFIPLLGFAYLAQAVVRGTVDLRRPVVATYTATGAVLLATFLHALTLLVNLLAMLQRTIALSPGAFGGGIAPELSLLDAAAQVLLVVAVALGLADPSVTIRGQRRRGLDPNASIHWPTPGGEVPAYRPVEWPADPTVPQPVAAIEQPVAAIAEPDATIEQPVTTKPARPRAARSTSANPKPPTAKAKPAAKKVANTTTKTTTRKSKESGA